jgi:mannosyl-3-phosphoglycerate phosphatase
LQWLANEYQTHSANKITTVAIGDGNNDIDMLEAADIALIVRSPVHEPPQLQKQDSVIISEATGPAGWNESVRILATKLNIKFTEKV